MLKHARFACSRHTSPPDYQCTWRGAAHPGAGGARSRTISDRMSANVYRETATLG